jgi:hypothetical protein
MKPFLFTLLALILAFAALAATSADVRSGVWTGDIREGRVHMNLFTGYREDRGMNSNMGFSLALSRFEGLSVADGETKFTLRAAAGLLTFDGHFSDSKGAGHFTFTPAPEFIREMQALGYTDLGDEKLLMFATTDFDPATLRGLKAIGYDVTPRELDEVAVFHITPELVREYGGAGYPKLTLRELVNLRVGRITPAVIKRYAAAGYPNLTARELSEFGIQRVTPEYIEELRRAGYDHIAPRQLVEMRIFRIDAAYIKEMRDIGVKDLGRMIELRTTGAGDILAKHRKR